MFFTWYLEPAGYSAHFQTNSPTTRHDQTKVTSGISTMTSVSCYDCFKKCLCLQGNSLFQLKHCTRHTNCWASLRQCFFRKSAVTNPSPVPWNLNWPPETGVSKWMVFLSFSCVGGRASNFLNWGLYNWRWRLQILAAEKYFCILNQNEFKTNCTISPRCFWKSPLSLHCSCSLAVLLLNTQHPQSTVHVSCRSCVIIPDYWMLLVL